jgi:hypothetical protein
LDFSHPICICFGYSLFCENSFIGSCLSSPPFAKLNLR